MVFVKLIEKKTLNPYIPYIRYIAFKRPVYDIWLLQRT